MSESKPYGYFDTPEGEDVFKKLLVALKPAALTGVAISTVDVLCFPVPRSYLQLVGRYAFFTLPVIGMATAFVVTSNIAVNYRKKDDKANWVAGAVAAGSIFGAWRRSTIAGVSAAAIFSGIAILKKHALQEGWILFPTDKKVAFGGLHASRYDFTLTKERPRNWVTGKE